MLTMASCATGTSSPTITTNSDVEGLYTERQVRAIAQPIKLNRDDRLTKKTGVQIEKHNNRIWCEFPTLRPLGFDASVCVIDLTPEPDQ